MAHNIDLEDAVGGGGRVESHCGKRSSDLRASE